MYQVPAFDILHKNSQSEMRCGKKVRLRVKAPAPSFITHQARVVIYCQFLFFLLHGKNLKEIFLDFSVLFKYDHLLLLVHIYLILLIISHSNGKQSVLVVGGNCTYDLD